MIVVATLTRALVIGRKAPYTAAEGSVGRGMRVWIDLTNRPAPARHAPDRGAPALRRARGIGHRARLRTDGRTGAAARLDATVIGPPSRRAARREGSRAGVAIVCARALGKTAALRPRARPRLQRRDRRRCRAADPQRGRWFGLRVGDCSAQRELPASRVSWSCRMRSRPRGWPATALAGRCARIPG